MRTTKRFHLNSMPSAQCTVEFVLHDGELTHVRFWSYSTLELDIYKSIANSCADWFVTVCAYVGYSATTARHINRFTTELFGHNLYHELKKVDIDCDAPYFLTDNEVGCFYNYYLNYGKQYR